MEASGSWGGEESSGCRTPPVSRRKFRMRFGKGEVWFMAGAVIRSCVTGRLKNVETASECSWHLIDYLLNCTSE